MKWISIVKLQETDLGQWFNICFEGMKQPTTVLRDGDEDIAEMIERARQQWLKGEKES